jgi:hypothetical protein
MSHDSTEQCADNAAIAGDEGKPRCKRCIDVDAECQYSAHIQFLDKNSWVLTNSTVSSGESSSAPRPDNAERDDIDPGLLQVPAQVQMREQEQEQPSDVGHISSSAEPPQALHDNNSASLPNEPASDAPQRPGHINSSAESQANQNDNSTSIPNESVSDEPQSTGSSPRWDEKWPVVGQCSLTADEVELLRHFGHFVAPWVSLQIPPCRSFQ